MEEARIPWTVSLDQIKHNGRIGNFQDESIYRKSIGVSKSHQQCCANIVDFPENDLPSTIQPSEIYAVTKGHTSTKILNQNKTANERYGKNVPGAAAILRGLRKQKEGRPGKNEAESPQTTGNSTLVPPRRIKRYRQNRNPVILPKIQSDMR
ncbi:MAG: hypothetical protein IJV54_15285 [Bacteroidales bacterium]|nr:hypothetical protein [Bacteroidales bacterium]MBQ9713642.1 hypothetical protein [Bacteroidales bacterium]